MLKCQWCCFFVISLFLPSSAQAQLVADTTLGREQTIINEKSDTFHIEGGSTRGDNLFHSFEEFNIQRGEQVYFHSNGAERIFSRVTGSNSSTIDGVLGSEDPTDIFLMNPNGVTFYSNADLDINGDFFVTTASSLFFDEFEFSADKPSEVDPLLTVRGDVGFSFSLPPQPILVKGMGHDLRFLGEPGFSTFSNQNTSSVITVPAASRLFFLGGDIGFNLREVDISNQPEQE